MRRRLLVLAAAVACGTAWAAAPKPTTARPPTESEVFAGVVDRIDDDGDGTISRAEWMRYSPEALLFDEFDFDGDAALDADEIGTMFTHVHPGLRGRESGAGDGPP